MTSSIDQNKLLRKLLVNKSLTERECTVTDRTTNHVRGSFLITDSDGWHEEVNADEMRNMLDKPLQQT